jgi:hypothetical protein
LRKIFFCPNQVSLVIALACIRKFPDSRKAHVFYWPDRCDLSVLLQHGGSDKLARFIRYSRMTWAIFGLSQWLAGSIETFVPHEKIGRLVNWLCRHSLRNSLLDDGLDTFRDVPQNLNPSRYPTNTRFYTFDYDSSLGKWLGHFEVTAVEQVIALAFSQRPEIPPRNWRRWVVESPPLQSAVDRLPLDEQDSVLITHSNLNKRCLESHWQTGPQIAGSGIAIEKSLLQFDGELFVGESMVAVFAAHLPGRRFRFRLFVAASKAGNLRPLIAAASAGGATIELC